MKLKNEKKKKIIKISPYEMMRTMRTNHLFRLQSRWFANKKKKLFHNK